MHATINGIYNYGVQYADYSDLKQGKLCSAYQRLSSEITASGESSMPLLLGCVTRELPFGCFSLVLKKYKRSSRKSGSQPLAKGYFTKSRNSFSVYSLISFSI